MNMRIIVVLLLICIFFLCVFIVVEKIKNQNEKEKIIRFLENILEGRENEYCCYKNSEESRIIFLLKNLEYNKRLNEEKTLQEKEGIKCVISNLSHQLKTPLSNIKLYGEFLENQSLSRDKKDLFQKKMRRQIEKLEWILGSLIKCARLEEGAIVFEVSMNPIKKTIIQAIDTIALKAGEKNIEIITKQQFEDISLYHHIKWTREVFVNILENSIKYSPEHSLIEIGIEKLDTYTKIFFKDEGIGIREEEYVKIFQRFYRSKDVENEEGSGIGLYLCRLILEMEKGNIVVKSQYGKGSVFEVYLLNYKP